MCTLYTMYMHMFFEFIITFILSFSDHPCECHYHSKNESLKFYNPPYFAKNKKKKIKDFLQIIASYFLQTLSFISKHCN